MTNPKQVVPDGMMPCASDPRGFHEKLPCSQCGNHAGGCVSATLPNSRCINCEAVLCIECEHKQREEPAVRCSRCWATYRRILTRAGWWPGFWWGMLVGTLVAFLVLMTDLAAIGGK